MYADSHAHLYFDHYKDDLNQIIETAEEEGIGLIINAASDLKSSKQTLNLVEKYKIIYGATGIHPCDVQDHHFDDLKSIRSMLTHEKIVAVGEVGLDYYHSTKYVDEQKKFFIRQLEISLEEDLPIIIHSRNALKDLKKIINEVSPRYKGVLHCYEGSIKDLDFFIDKGFYFSYTGTVTYKKNDRINVAKETPLEKLLIETDSPFLSPVPFRGKRNDPIKVKYVAKAIAEAKNLTPEQIEEATWQNTLKLFSKISYT